MRQSFEQAADLREVSRRGCVEEDRAVHVGGQSRERAVHRFAAGFELGPRELGDVLRGLCREVPRQVGFVHRRERMRAHDRMAVEAVHLAVGT